MAKNYGIARAKVEYLDQAPGIDPNPYRYNYDISAYHWDLLKNTPYVKPVLVDQVMNTEGTFSALMPSSRIYYIDNVLSDTILNTTTATSSATHPVLKWSLLSNPLSGIPYDILHTQNTSFQPYTLITPNHYNVFNLSGYKGPTWENAVYQQLPQSNDRAITNSWWTVLNNAGGSAAPTLTTSTTITVPTTSWIYQTKVQDGLWWGIESQPFLYTNQPFWVFFIKMQVPPSSQNETCYVIRLGADDSSTPKNLYDIYIPLNKKPVLIDYLDSTPSSSAPSVAVDTDGSSTDTSGVGGNGDNQTQTEWPDEVSKVMTNENEYICVGVMTVAGRLVITINNIPLVYTRINKSQNSAGEMAECQIAAGKIQIFGTNIKTMVNISMMNFADLGVVSLPIPHITPSASGASTTYKGVNNHGATVESPCILPTDANNPATLYGCDCKSFKDLDGGSDVSPNGFAFHTEGLITMVKPIANAFASLPDNDFSLLFFQPADGTLTLDSTDYVIPFGECPYFFRLKGWNSQDATNSSSTGTDITNNLISLNVSETADDYFHIVKKANLTFYNENNVVGDFLLHGQKAIRIYLAWKDSGEAGALQDSDMVFTGLVTSVNKTEVAGKETLTINCEDYYYILQNIPIINSPFYDGMVGYYAIQDLAKRAGVLSFIKDWDSEDDYFLPSGYSFTEPRMKFEPEKMISECIMLVVQRFEAFVYFDSQGKFHVKKLPGGLFSVGTSESAVQKFSSDIANAGTIPVILEERNVTVDYISTVNQISITSNTRDTRNWIFYGLPAPADNNNILFKKPLLIKQGALGDFDTVKGYAHDLAKRVFSPILKTSFKCVDNPGKVIALDFVTLDDAMFRVTSIKRDFSAEENNLNVSYDCEWLGGSSGS